MSSNINRISNLRILSDSNIMPITLDEAKLFLRVEHNNDNNFITNLIRCTYEMAISHIKLSLLTRTIEVYYKKIARGYVQLPYGPVQTIKSIKYVKNDNFINELKLDRDVQFNSEKCLYFKADYDLPIIITYKAGFSEKPDDVPYSLRQAMLTHLATLYDHRCGEVPIPESVKLIYQHYRNIKV